VYGVTPDLATFGKALANGFAIAALVGRRNIMRLGSIYGRHGKRVHLLSSTYGGDVIGLAAAIETLKVLKKYTVSNHIGSISVLLRKRLHQIIHSEKLQDILSVIGSRGRLALLCQPFGTCSASEVKTYFFQELIREGVLFNGYFAPSFSHGKREVEFTARAWRRACRKLRRALDSGNLREKLVGEPIKAVFRTFN
jgi:glutamate-1-semialdehyde aminotransferase